MACSPHSGVCARLVVEVGDQHRLAELFGLGRPARRVSEVELQERLWSISIDPDRALLEWLQALGGRVSGRILASSGTFQYFAAAAPGAKELVSMVKIWELTRGERRRGRATPTTSSCSTRPPPATRSACCTRRRPSARSRVSARSPRRRSGWTSCSRPGALELSGRRARDRDGRHRDARAPGRPTAPAWATPRGGRGQQRAATAASPSRSSLRIDALDRPPTRPSHRLSARRSLRTRCTTVRAFNTTSSRAYAAEASRCWACPSCSAPSSTCRRYSRSPSTSGASCERNAAMAAGVATIAVSSPHRLDLLRSEPVAARGRDLARASPTASRVVT